MYLQVKNTTKDKHNQILTTELDLVKDVKKQGWRILDCKVTQMQDALIETKYRGADGKNIPAGQKQYKSRAKSRNNLNTNLGVKLKREEALILVN